MRPPNPVLQAESLDFLVVCPKDVITLKGDRRRNVYYA